MNEKILITELNYKDIFYSLKYGYITITYKDKSVHSLITNMIEVTNEFTGLNTVREVNDVIDDLVDNEWVSIDVPNTYRLICSLRDTPIPVLPPDNYEIERLAIFSKENSIVSVINNIEPSLFKYAKRIAFKHDVKFTGSGFNGSVKPLSIRKQIEEAFLSGKYNISFSSDNFNVQTIRNHASVYGSLIGKKLKVEISKGLVTVHFKELDENTILLNSAKELFDKIGSKIGIEDRDLFFRNLLGNITEKEVLNELPVIHVENNKLDTHTYNPLVVPLVVPEANYKLSGKTVTFEEYKNAKNWQRAGFASEYNWENGIEGDIYMYPKDARFEDVNDDDEEIEPAKYDWGDDDSSEF